MLTLINTSNVDPGLIVSRPFVTIKTLEFKPVPYRILKFYNIWLLIGCLVKAVLIRRYLEK